VLELKKNLYGQKQAGRVWYQQLSNGLIKLGFKQSNEDECVCSTRIERRFLVYVDNGIIAGLNNNEIEQIIKDLQSMFDVSKGLKRLDGLSRCQHRHPR
jgi:Reverse transcriptase (RNA-dependent DNA polymerase)